LEVNETKYSIQNSYLEERPRSLLGYVLDEALLNLYGKVYGNDLQKLLKYLNSNIISRHSSKEVKTI
jgi:hypothetical protein